MKLIYLKSALKCDSFDVALYIKIQFFRVLVTIEPDRSLLQFVTTNFLKEPVICICNFCYYLNGNHLRILLGCLFLKMKRKSQFSPYITITKTQCSTKPPEANISSHALLPFWSFQCFTLYTLPCSFSYR